MIRLNDFSRKNEYEWVLPKEFRKGMRVPVKIFSTQDLLQQSLADLSIEQAINSSMLPGLCGSLVVMPDMHQGYGFPIGGVAASSMVDGVVSPGGIGYDINCGVRLLSTQIPIEMAKPLLKKLAISINQFCPSGIGSSGGIKLNESEIRKVCKEGSGWAVKNGYASKEEVLKTEDKGCLPEADFEKISSRALQRGIPQLGTLGSGNHFIEVDFVSQVFDPILANALGLQQGNLVVMIHCGSRGLGHQVCTDYVQIFQKAIIKYDIQIPDRELVCAPIESLEGRDYLAAMRAAANYAFCNRQVLAHLVERAFEQVFAPVTKDWNLHQVYDIAHNIGKIETHWINGKKTQVCVHRKGATRAFGPGEPELPDVYRNFGQPVLVPGSMGTSSWVLMANHSSMEKSFGSCCHGAGRLMSRQQAKKNFRGDQLIHELENQGIQIQAGSLSSLAEEAPLAYKDVDEVIKVVVGVNIANMVAKLKPIAVVKG